MSYIQSKSGEKFLISYGTSKLNPESAQNENNRTVLYYFKDVWVKWNDSAENFLKFIEWDGGKLVKA